MSKNWYSYTYKLASCCASSDWLKIKVSQKTQLYGHVVWEDCLVVFTASRFRSVMLCFSLMTVCAKGRCNLIMEFMEKEFRIKHSSKKSYFLIHIKIQEAA